MNGREVSTENDHVRPTTASIDRRVERLEVSQAATDRKVDQLDMKLGFLRDTMDLRFASIESKIDTQGQKLDAFMARMDALISEAMKSAGDLRAQPLGRQIDDRLTELEEKIERHDGALDEMRGLGSAVRGYILPIVAVAVSVASLLVLANGGI